MTVKLPRAIVAKLLASGKTQGMLLVSIQGVNSYTVQITGTTTLVHVKA